MHEHHLRAEGRYHWKMWVFVLVEILGAAVFIFASIYMK